MARGWEAAHVATNLREDDDCGQGADAGDRAQKHDQCPESGLTGLDLLVDVLDQHLDLLIDLRDRRGQGVVLPKMQPKQETVMICHSSAKRLTQCLARGS